MTRPKPVPCALIAAVAFSLMAAACASAGTSAGPSTPASVAPRPSSTGKLEILSPTNGEVIHGTSVPMKVKLTGAEIVPATTTHIVPDQGHLHVYLDNQIAGMNFQLDDTISNVSAGTHILRVEFVASDHLPFDPRVFEEVTFEVQP